MINESTDKKTILVIEDERPLAKVIKDKLEHAGFEVLTARTVDQGLEYMEEVSPIDAVWLDHYLFGEKTGLDFVAKLKCFDSKWRQIPIFVVSNTASTDNLQSYIRLGVNKYSVKSDHRLDEMTKEIKDYLDAPQE
jgi:DNA-binding response OmpR family regulator